jgi:decaprenylphospho-beta-D-erythro-pentofuranosid-2-ulose 2-reductase
MEAILILGANSDIGKAIAEEFASKKYAIQLAARNVERLLDVEANIHIQYDVMCSLHEFDALNFNSHAAFFESLPVIPTVVIAVFAVMTDEEMAFTNWQQTANMIDTNFTGTVSILNICSQYMRQQKRGCIAAISSVAGDRGRANKLIYGSTKAALNSYLSGLRNLLFKDGVHVLNIKLGYVRTRLTKDLQVSKYLMAEPNQVAKAIFKAVQKKKNTLYIKKIWWWIMGIIKCIPEPLFTKMKL